MGYKPTNSTVMVVESRGVHTLVESSQETGRGVLETMVGSMTAGGISGYSFQSRVATVVMVLWPEHAAGIAADGFGRKEIKDYLFENARMPLGKIKNRGHYGTRSGPEEYDSKPDDFMVPLVADVYKYLLVVAGGDGRHSSYFPAWSAIQRAVEGLEG